MSDTITVNMPIEDNPPYPGEKPVEPSVELIAGKFTSEQELEKATLELIKKQNEGNLEVFYKKLESELGKSTEKQSVPIAEQQSAEGSPPDHDVKNILENSGIDFNSLSEEYTAQGGLSDDSYAKLQAAGFPRDLVDNYIRGQEAIAAQRDTQIYNIVGGEDKYMAMVNWASTHLTSEEKDMYNKSLNTEAAPLAVEGLYARYQRATGYTGRLLDGNPVPSTTGGYQSEAQFKADLRDDRYRSDPAFRDQVARRLAQTTAF